MSDGKDAPKDKTPKKQKVSSHLNTSNGITGNGGDDDADIMQNSMKNQQEPEDVVVLKSILESMGVEKYEPRVITQLLEFIHRYTTEVLVDAQEYSTYANKSMIDPDDIRLAALSRLNHTYAQLPSRELMMELAEKRNVIPLPPIPSEYGVRLPPLDHQLTADNIRLYPSHPVQYGMPNNMPPIQHPSTLTPHLNQVQTPSLPKGSRNIKISTSPIQIKLSSYP